MDSVLNLFLSFFEGLIVLAVSQTMCGKKYTCKKNAGLLLLLSVVYAAVITFVGTFEGLSSLLIIVAFLYSLGANYLLAKGSILLRVTSLSLTWFFLHALDYVFSYGMMMLVIRVAEGSESLGGLIGSGNYEIVLTFVSLIIKLLLFYFFRKICKSFSTLGKKYLILLLAVSLGAYVLMSLFAGLIISDSVITIQAAVIFSVFFITVSLIATIFAVTLKTRYEKEMRENELMAMTNRMMKKNYEEMENSQGIIRQQVHDFKNHLLTLRGMLEKDETAKDYVESLLAVSYKQAKECQCGNNVIDSIINCKVAEAEAHDISFDYHVLLSSELYLSSVDICAILANQIDNAIEACSKIPDDKNRRVSVKIWQREDFVFFKVVNSCRKNPFNRKRELISTKADKSGLHGYGVKNIIRTAERYGGTVKNDYSDGEFTSIVMLPNNK